MGPDALALGKLFITPGAIELLDQQGVSACNLLQRHASTDWGDVGSDDWDANDQSLVNGTRILSAYVVHNASDSKVWIITEADRSSTTLLLQSEY